jgi:hypothetical protein
LRRWSAASPSRPPTQLYPSWIPVRPRRPAPKEGLSDRDRRARTSRAHGSLPGPHCVARLGSCMTQSNRPNPPERRRGSPCPACSSRSRR